MGNDVRKDLAYAIGDLRHAYAVLINGQLGNHRGFANGLISPQIRRLEGILKRIDDGEIAELPSEEDLTQVVGIGLAHPSVYMEGCPPAYRSKAKRMAEHILAFIRGAK